MKLFARDIRGNIKVWEIVEVDSYTATIFSGKLNGNLIETEISHADIKKEIASRIAKKRKEGYISSKDLGVSSMYGPGVVDFLNANLPMCNTDDNNNLKPMKCQPFKEGKLNYPVIGQPKLNGLRAVLRWEKWTEGEGLFGGNKEGAKLRTKEGLEYYMPHLTDRLPKHYFYIDDIELVFDGELYCHEMPLNQIKASCPMINSRGTLSNPSGDPTKISFPTFDLAIPDILQEDRLKLLQSSKIGIMLDFSYVGSSIIHNDEEAQRFRDACISFGYEGCVLREKDKEYAFGFRPSFIRKFKTHMDSEFLIVDVIAKPSDPTLPLFVLKNDVNNELFECNPSGDWDIQRNYMENRDNLKGKWATVRYRERTGTDKKLPFHANVIGIRNTKNEG